MKTGRYSIAELFGNRHIEQLVIPEIQRDYVWERRHVEHLLNSILSNFNAWRRAKVDRPLTVVANGAATNGRLGDGVIQSLQEEFAAFYARRTHATNIGFVYAYCDSDLPEQYFLIDGQQRLTTLYLCLLAVAARSTDLKDRFRARYCLTPAEPQKSEAVAPTKLDYRLREHTTEFLHQCVRYLLDECATADRLKQQSWYLERLKDDRTVQNLLGNFATIQELLSPALPDTELPHLYGYLEELVECWYFDTNESAQGEELYLYLNARGESIADNENMKARLLAGLNDSAAKEDWGRKWEEWQDYFWRHRNVGLSGKTTNPNADRGFNSFLCCIEYLERLRNKGAAEPVSLETIERYHNALCWLEENKERFDVLYQGNASWVHDWFHDTWGSFNDLPGIDWTVDLGDKNKSRERNHMVLIWGSLLCVLCALEKEDNDWGKLDSEQIFRAIRIIFLRFHNFGRAVVSLPEMVKGILNNNPAVLGGDDEGEDASEERIRWDYLDSLQDEERRKIESVIWMIEDHPLNRKGGRGLGNLNITHLVDLTAPTTNIQHLEKVRVVFDDLFPRQTNSRRQVSDGKKLASALLYYGAFWNRVTPPYYENYDLGDWPRTIRGKGSEEKNGGGPTVFRQFFDEFLQAWSPSDECLEKLAIAKKGTVQVDPSSETDLRKALIWYSEKLGTRYLERGMHVAKTYEDRDTQFPGLWRLWNTKGDFRGNNGNQRIGDLIKEENL